MLETDFLIIGAGIAGASIAYRLAPEANVILVDMEAQADYHTTGRSAAFYAETYGGPAVQPLTTASKEFLSSPPEGFTAYPLMHELGALHVFRTGQESQAQQLFASLHQSLPDVVMLDRNQVLGKAPQLAPSDIAGGVFDPGCSGLDVAVLHQAFLRAAKKAGAKTRLNTMLKGAEFVRGLWRVETTDTVISAKVLVNTAGAWADKVAELCGIKPLGLQPLRRTIVTVDTPDGHIRAAQSPIIMEIGKEHYFKPEGQGYLLTPGDEILMPPSDVQPELEDVALAIEQFEQATKLSVKKIGAKWAGLRTFASDRTPIIGYASDHEHFFWSVGQGGYGIQTAPAWSDLAATLITRKSVPNYQVKCGVRAETYDPARFFNMTRKNASA